MSPTNPTRRQVYELTAEDLSRHLIWEFCSDEEGVEGQDEATVRPALETEVPGYSPGAYIVAADAVLGNDWPAQLTKDRHLLGEHSTTPFPITFTTRANVNKAPLRFTAEGFMGLDLNRRIIVQR